MATPPNVGSSKRRKIVEYLRSPKHKKLYVTYLALVLGGTILLMILPAALMKDAPTSPELDLETTFSTLVSQILFSLQLQL
jgi:hypothetical protein